ncbi:MAG TPA: putative glycoside hydrolase [Opitutus sp.]|nr:putative glycoside hydrolase [Opitutus sp.]
MKFPPCRRLAALFLLTASLLAAKAPGDFPRLFGMNIGRKIYDDPGYRASLAKLDVVILGFYPGWNPHNEPDPIGAVLHDLRRLNPALKIGQYTSLNESYGDPAMVGAADLVAALDRHHWWARNAAGDKVQWTPRYHTWETNNTAWAPPDAAGRRYPQWLAARNDRLLFKPHPEFDIWYVDNVMWRPRETADWDRDGKDDDRDDPRIQAAYRAGMASYWTAIRRLEPSLTIMGNTDSDLSAPEFRRQLDAAFLEGWMGARYSIERRKGWAAAMELYRTTLGNLPPGAMLAVNIHAPSDDFRFFRYAFASCLLDDGYFSFSDSKELYSSVVWFDEFDIPLGRARSAPPAAAWQEGVWRRDFDGGIALVNPTEATVTVQVGSGLHRLAGKQDPRTNDGRPASAVTLASKDGIILVRDRASPPDISHPE